MGVVTYQVLQSILTRLSFPSFPGELALDILEAGPYSRIVVEVDWTDGGEPSQIALQIFRQRLVTYTLKEEVEVTMSNSFETEVTSFQTRDLFDVETSHRDFRTGEDTLALYIVYLPGTLADGQDSIAATYTSSSVAVFKEVVKKVARVSRGVSEDDIETSALVHELGHLFGLVNIVYESDLDYEDPDHPFHSTNKSCVMYWAIEAGPLVTERPPTDFGDEALYDILKLREGGYEISESRLREPTETVTSPAFGEEVATVRGADKILIFLCRGSMPPQRGPWQRALCS